jgi:hypothetical protein
MAKHLRDEQKPQEWIFALRYDTISVIASEKLQRQSMN